MSSPKAQKVLRLARTFGRERLQGGSCPFQEVPCRCIIICNPGPLPAAWQ